MKNKFLACITTSILIVTSTVDAQTQFIKYKNYLIPIGLECQTPKIIITTDLRAPGFDGNTLREEDDIQSLIHYLASSYRFDTRGIISTPGNGMGNVGEIRKIIDNHYKPDRNGLINVSSDYPQDFVTAQGSDFTRPPVAFPNGSTADLPTYSASSHLGAKLIRDEVAKIINNNECGPVHVLAWGALTSVAIALNGSDGSEQLSNDQVASKLRVYSIGSTNIGADNTSSGGPTREISYAYIYNKYLKPGTPNKLWFIENNSTFRGVYNQADSQPLKDAFRFKGCLGARLFATNTGSIPIKMGDTPSVLYMMNGKRQVPTTPSWGGQFQRAAAGSKPYWKDGAGPNTITPIGNGDFTTNPNSIYGAWYADMGGLQSCGNN